MKKYIYIWEVFKYYITKTLPNRWPNLTKIFPSKAGTFLYELFTPNGEKVNAEISAKPGQLLKYFLE